MTSQDPTKPLIVLQESSILSPKTAKLSKQNNSGVSQTIQSRFDQKETSLFEKYKKHRIKSTVPERIDFERSLIKPKQSRLQKNVKNFKALNTPTQTKLPDL